MNSRASKTPNPILKHPTATGNSEGVYELTWDIEPTGRSLHVFGGQHPETIDWRKPLARVSGRTSTRVNGLDRYPRYYFALVAEGESPVIVAERHVRLEGSVNTRDLGGYLTADGRRVKWGHLFRSDALSRLTDRDRQSLTAIGIRTVIDLRSTQETQAAPDLLGEPPLARYRHFPIQSGEMNYLAAMDRLKSGDADWLTEEYMCRGYTKNLDEFGHVWRELFLAIADTQGRPAVFHCTGGKDRAGTAAALILLLLGVPKDTVISDHQLSNQYIAGILEFLYEKIESYGIPREKVVPYFTAPLSAIRRLIDHLHAYYRSVDHYLIDHAGLPADTLDRFRESMLD
jgi:protein-tyrosine phosphatase